MPNVYTGSTSDGMVFNLGTSNAVTVRGDSSTSGVSSEFTKPNSSGIVNYKSARAGGMWWNYRSYFEFVLTGESGTVDSCNLVVFLDNQSSNLDSGGITTAHSTIIAVEASSLAVNDSDYGNCFTDTASPPALGTRMSNATPVSSTAQYQNIAITGDVSGGGIKVINDAIGSAKPVICLMDYTWDYSNVDIATIYGTSEFVRHSVYYTEDTTGARDPYLSITYTSGVTVTYNATFFGANF